MPDLADLPVLLALLNDLGRGLAALVIFLSGYGVLIKLRHVEAMNVLLQDEKRLELDERRWKLRKAQEKPPKGGKMANPFPEG